MNTIQKIVCGGVILAVFSAGVSKAHAGDREWATAGPTLLVVPRADTAVPPPAPGDWSRLVVLIARTTKPDGRPCDDVYRFCSGAECDGAAPATANPE